MKGIADFCDRPARARARRSTRPAYETMEVRLVPSGVTAAFAVAQDWGSGFQASITLTSTQATAVNNWSLAFDYSATITDIWNAAIVSHVGNHYVIAGDAWDNSLPGKSSVAFGFNGTPGGTTAAPANYTLNGVPLSGGGSVPPPPPAISINNVTVAEPASGSTPASFTVSLSAAATTPITVAYSTADVSAKAGVDYTATSGTLTFAAGQTSRTVTVQVMPDKALTTSETFQLDLTNPVGATLAQSVGTATIDAPPIPPPPPPPPASTTNMGTASFAVTSDWGSGFQGQITVTNASKTPWVAWTLTFNFPYQITSMWDASIYSHTGTQYVIQNASYDGALAPGASVSFGLTGAPGGVTGGISNASVRYGVPVDHPPIAVNASAWTPPGTAVSIPVLANDSDPDGDPITLLSATQGQHGKVVVNAKGTVTYTPAAGFTGTDSFSYTIGDGLGGIATTSVTVKVSALVWPAHVFAPYVDMTLTPMTNLASIAENEGVKYFSLAFITADSHGQPSWGGYLSYEVNGGAFDQAIRAQINALRGLGGDVAVSFGGAAGQELAQVITSVPALTSAYQAVINAYQLTRIDFDIEGAAEADHASIDRRSQAIAALQATAAAQGKTLQVSFTLPVLPSGLTSDGLYVLQSALKYGVKITAVNVMAMDYGDSAAPNPAGRMGTYAIDAATSVYGQLQTLYGTSLSSAQLWGMIGVTPMIGLNDDTSEVFDQAAAAQLLAFAEQKGLGEIAMWSLNRDQADPSGKAVSYVDDTSSSIVQTPYQFSKILEAFTS